MWLKIRELVSTQVPGVTASYSRLLCNTTYEIARIARVFGFDDLSATELAHIASATSAPHLKTDAKTSSSTKLRDGGVRTHKDYGIAADVLVWMDQVTERLGMREVHRPAVCEVDVSD